MSDDQRQIKFASLGENVSKRCCGKILELVHHKDEIAPLGFLDIHARHGAELDFSDQERAQQSGRILADAAFGNIDEEDLALVHRLAHVETRLGLSNDVADQGIGNELADLVLNRGSRFGGEFVGVLGKFLRPEGPNFGIFDLFYDRFAVVFFRQHPVDPQKRRTRNLQKGQNRIVENVLHARRPRVDPDFFEHGHHAVRNQVTAVIIHLFHDIERDRVLKIGRIDINHIVDPFGRNIVQQVLNRISMGIDECQPAPILNILNGDVFEQFRFAHTRLADDIHVPAAIVHFNAKIHALIAEIRLAKEHDRIVRGWRHEVCIYCVGNPAGGWPFLASTRGNAGALICRPGR